MNTKTQKWILTGVLALTLLSSAFTAQGQRWWGLEERTREIVSSPQDCDPGFIPICWPEPIGGEKCNSWKCIAIEDVSVGGGAQYTGVQDIRDIQVTLENVVGWIQVFFYIIATLTMILAAWSYLNSGGDETKTKAAKNYVIYSLIAIAIAIIAGGIVTLVRNFVG